MFCQTCGNRIPDEAKFCPVCGAVTAQQSVPVEAPTASAPVEAPTAEASVLPPEMAAAPVYAAPAAPAAPAKRLSGKTIGIIAGCAAALLLIVLLAALPGGSGSAQFIGTPHIDFSYENHAYIFCGEKMIAEFDIDEDAEGYNDFSDINGDKLSLSSCSNDRTVSAFIAADGTLRVADKGNVTLVAEEDVKSAIVSDDGSAVVYLLNDGKNPSLCIYRGGKSETIAELDFPEDSDPYSYSYFFTFRVSPDGKAVLFTQYDKDGKYTAYGWSGGEPVELEDNADPIAVSDGGRIAYLNDVKHGKILVLKNFEETAKIKDCTVLRCAADCETLLLRNNDDETLIYDPSMDEPMLVTKKKVSPADLPYGVLANDSFDDLIVEEGDGITRYIRKGDDFEKYKIVSGCDDYIISADRSMLLYSDEEELLLVSTKKGAKEIVITDELREGTIFYATSDLKHIYFFDEDDNLMYSNGKEDSYVEVFDDYVFSVRLLENGTLLFTCDNEVYYSKKGSEAALIDEPDEVDNALTRCGLNVIFARYEDELYVSTDGIKFTETEADLG